MDSGAIGIFIFVCMALVNAVLRAEGVRARGGGAAGGTMTRGIGAQASTAGRGGAAPFVHGGREGRGPRARAAPVTAVRARG